MSNIIPPSSARGVFELKSPWQTVAGVEYWVAAIRSFDDLKARNVDVVGLVYGPVGLDSTDYQKDILAGARIVTLMSLSQDPIYVPSTYIAKYPVSDLIPYSRIVLTANLGPLPDSYDTALLEQAVKDAVSGFIGVEADIQLGRLTHTDVITPEEHSTLEDARLANVRYSATAYADKLTAEQRVRDLEQRLELYEEILISNGLVDIQP